MAEGLVAKPPILVAELGVLVSVFESVVDAETGIEAYDVPNMEAFDSTGQSLKIKPRRDDLISLSQHKPPEWNETRLREVIAKALDSIGRSPSSEASLEQLVLCASIHFLDPGRPDVLKAMRSFLRRKLRFKS